MRKVSIKRLTVLLILPTILLFLTGSLMVFGISGDIPHTRETRDTAISVQQARTAMPTANAGSFELVIYNIAGLPDLVSPLTPSANIPHMGPLLSRYDIAMVQEDFAYTGELRAGVDLPFQSRPLRSRGWLDISDGLTRFSRFPFATTHHTSWRDCHGYLSDRNDCLAPKGFSMASHYISRQTRLDIYNIHMDAGTSPGDARTRLNQVEQLLGVLEERSRGRAVIVAGDTNLRTQRLPEDKETFEYLLQAAGLRDACHITGCPEVNDGIDKVLYRSSPRLNLAPRSWRVDNSFTGPQGKSLSDHQPIAVTFQWNVREGFEARLSQ